MITLQSDCDSRRNSPTNSGCRLQHSSSSSRSKRIRSCRKGRWLIYITTPSDVRYIITLFFTWHNLHNLKMHVDSTTYGHNWHAVLCQTHYHCRGEDHVTWNGLKCFLVWRCNASRCQSWYRLTNRLAAIRNEIFGRTHNFGLPNLEWRGFDDEDAKLH